MRDSDVRAGFLDETLNFLGVNAAALRVDVCAVRVVMRNCHFRAQLTQNARCRFVGGAIRNIHSDVHFLE